MRKIIYTRFAPAKWWVVTNGCEFRPRIFRFKSDAQAYLANLKDDTYWIQEGKR